MNLRIVTNDRVSNSISWLVNLTDEEAKMDEFDGSSEVFHPHAAALKYKACVAIRCRRDEKRYRACIDEAIETLTNTPYVNVRMNESPVFQGDVAHKLTSSEYIAIGQSLRNTNFMYNKKLNEFVKKKRP